jgi:peptidoglycan/xylan/chitin deacetylase (PgdA/CDA1 family)
MRRRSLVLPATLAAVVTGAACAAPATSVTGGGGGQAPLAVAARAAAPVAGLPVIVRGDTWYLRSSLTSGQATTTFRFGNPYAFPLSGDWDGDGTATVGAVVRNAWSLRNTNAAGPADVSFRYGSAGDLPVVGDWDGDGVDTPGVVRGNVWYLRNSLSTGTADAEFAYGRATDRPVVADWDGDGTATPGVVRGNTWYLSNDDGATADVTFAYGSGCEVALPGTAALARTAGGTPAPASLAGRDITVLPTSRRVVALTFDAGANADAVASITGTLARTCTPATFFLTGAWARQFPVEARRISQRYPVGNHTDTHPDLTTLTAARVRAQVTTAAADIRAATAYDTHPLFRFPFGARDTRTISLVNGLGYTGVRWTVDALGWKGTSGGQSVRTVVDRVVDAARPGAIVLMHVGSNPDDGSTLDADALPAIISELTGRGYTFVTLPEMLR